MGASLAPDPGQVKPARTRGGPTNGRYATVLSANSARRAAQLPCIALARYPDRSASGIAYLAFLATMPPPAWPPPGRDLLGAGPRWPGPLQPCRGRTRPRGSRLLECVFHPAIDPGGPAPRLGLLECRIAHLGAQRG